MAESVTLSRVKATGAGIAYDRVRLQIADGFFRLFDTSGEVLVSGIVETWTQEGKTITAMVEGVEWIMTRKGCGCGGG